MPQILTFTLEAHTSIGLVRWPTTAAGLVLSSAEHNHVAGSTDTASHNPNADGLGLHVITLRNSGAG